MSELALRVAARYKSKKKVKPKGGGDEFVVYEYSDRQVANRHRDKAERLQKLNGSIGKLRTKVRKDMRSEDPETRLTALAVALMDETAERVGNDESAEERGHFGVTGWQRKHLSFKGGTCTISYTGKSGVRHKKKIEDAGIRKALRDAYEAGESDDDSVLSWEGGSVTAEKVNAYLKPFNITAKDLRGLHANVLMREKLKATRKGQLPEDKKERTKQLKDEFKKALEETAEEIGHTPSMLRSSYLTPGLEDSFLKDGEVSEHFVKDASLAGRVLVRYLAD